MDQTNPSDVPITQSPEQDVQSVSKIMGLPKPVFIMIILVSVFIVFTVLFFVFLVLKAGVYTSPTTVRTSQPTNKLPISTNGL